LFFTSTASISFLVYFSLSKRHSFGVLSSLTLRKIGDLIITSPILPIKEMVKVSKDLLKDKQVRSYLESVKENKIKSGGKYFG